MSSVFGDEHCQKRCRIDATTFHVVRPAKRASTIAESEVQTTPVNRSIVPAPTPNRSPPKSPGAIAKIVQRCASELQSSKHAVVLFQGVPRQWFETHSELLRAMKCEFICTDNVNARGDIRGYDLPTRPHEAASRQLAHWFVPACGGPGNIDSIGSTLMSVGNNSYEPDDALIPVGRATGGPLNACDGKEFPTIVIESAHSETNLHVLAKAQEWIGATTTVQECWVIRVSSPKWVTAGRMWLKRFIRGIEGHTHFEFGTRYLPAYHGVQCTGRGLVILTIPTATAFHGAPIPGGLPPNVSIDLFDVQTAVLRSL